MLIPRIPNSKIGLRKDNMPYLMKSKIKKEKQKYLRKLLLSFKAPAGIATITTDRIKPY